MALEEYEEKEREFQTLHGRSLAKSRLRDRIESAKKGVIERFRQREGDPDAEDDDEVGSQDGRPRWGETTQSDHKLPKIPSKGDPEFKI